MTDLAAASHDHELPRRDYVTLNIDGWQMGVGGDNSWSLPVHQEYRVHHGETDSFSILIRPIHLK